MMMSISSPRPQSHRRNSSSRFSSSSKTSKRTTTMRRSRSVKYCCLLSSSGGEEEHKIIRFSRDATTTTIKMMMTNTATIRKKKLRGGRVVVAANGGDEKNKAPDPTIHRDKRTKEEEDRAFNEFLMGDIRKTFKKALKRVSSLPLAISGVWRHRWVLGFRTVIEQNKSYAWYVENYPVGETHRLFGLLDFTFILNSGLDHVYTTWYFLSLLSLLAVSLTACTATKQLPCGESPQSGSLSRNRNF